jgi:hypothetical protein
MRWTRARSRALASNYGPANQDPDVPNVLVLVRVGTAANGAAVTDSDREARGGSQRHDRPNDRPKPTTCLLTPYNINVLEIPIIGQIVRS